MTRDTLVLAHGAGSCAAFLADAFPADRVGVAAAEYLDDRTGDRAAVEEALACACAQVDGPVVVGGVSLGAHAAAALLASDHAPRNAVAGLVVMPAWTGPPDRVAALTAAAAGALAALTPAGVLADLDSDDWVTPQLARAWAMRDVDLLVSELERAAVRPAPTEAELRRIGVPVALVALRSDPLHPEAVAKRWARAIPRSTLVTIARSEPAHDLAVFADRARDALVAANPRRTST